LFWFFSIEFRSIDRFHSILTIFGEGKKKREERERRESLLAAKKEKKKKTRPPLHTHLHTYTHTLHTQNHGRRIENEENADETPGPTKLEEVEREGEED
jgi:hypothetical protein